MATFTLPDCLNVRVDIAKDGNPFFCEYLERAEFEGAIRALASLVGLEIVEPEPRSRP